MSESLHHYWTQGGGLTAMSDPSEEVRRVGLELAALVGLAQEFDLPLPVEPTRMVRGVIVHPTAGPGLATWTPPCVDRP